MRFLTRLVHNHCTDMSETLTVHLVEGVLVCKYCNTSASRHLLCKSVLEMFWSRDCNRRKGVTIGTHGPFLSDPNVVFENNCCTDCVD